MTKIVLTRTISFESGIKSVKSAILIVIKPIIITKKSENRFFACFQQVQKKTDRQEHTKHKRKLSRTGKKQAQLGQPQLPTRSLTRVHFSRSLRKKNTSRKVLQVIKVLATFNFYNIKVTYFCWNLSLLKQMLQKDLTIFQIGIALFVQCGVSF